MNVFGISSLLSPLSFAYIGPGAGFVFLGSFLLLLSALALALLSLLSWPFRLLLSTFLRRGKKRAKTTVRRVVIVGLDGLDPRRAKRLMAEGRLPNFTKLADQGCSEPLETTCPPISPVAWSSFATGANPGKHNIFDFLNRDPRTYLPELSTSRVRRGANGKPEVQLLRKSKPFWHVLGEYGVFSTILRVPVTFPPAKFNGLLLSGLGVPDLRGTQGTFTFYTSEPDAARPDEGGEVIRVSLEDHVIATHLPGPPSPKGDGHAELHCPLRAELRPGRDAVVLHVGGEKVVLKKGKHSDWIRVAYRVPGRLAKIHGMCRFYLVSIEPYFKMYASPIHIDPENPALPVSHPAYYSVYLAKLHGPFATLGLAEDTWALNEGVLDDEAFLEQVYAIHEERERIFFDALARTRRGVCACVFEASDRIQHMFTRADNPEKPDEKSYGEGVIEDLYVRMDDLVGRTLERLRKGDVMMVISDHGFTEFRRGVNLNTWLREKGYLAVKKGAEDEQYLQAVDWSKTRAYTFGLAGIYLNMKGRERDGIVDPDEASALKAEMTSALRDLKDPETGCHAVRDVHDAAEVYQGPYAGKAPDLVVGLEDGYRASWDAAVGKVSDEIFSDNLKKWRGDHCVDRSLVPGVFFCNRKVDVLEGIRLMDIGPTLLKMLGIPVPSYMDGHAKQVRDALS